MLGFSHSKPDLIVHSTKPLNADPPLHRLRSGFVTKVADFYIGSHGDVPALDAETHKVRVTGQVEQPLDLSVADLKARFTPKTVTAVMQCAGNRRADMQQVEKTSGDPWVPGAIGNAEWTGIPLADVLRATGASEANHLHVAFDALDIAENHGAADAPYGVSILMPKALSGDVLLAWAMNGEPLTAEHGAPLRIVVPGYAGVRSAKWVGEIRVQDRPSEAFQQSRDYLLFPPDMRKETQDVTLGMTIDDHRHVDAGDRTIGGDGVALYLDLAGRRPAVESGDNRGARQHPLGLDALARDARHPRWRA